MKTHILKPILIAIVCLLATPSFFGMDQHAAKRRRLDHHQLMRYLPYLTDIIHEAAECGDTETIRQHLTSPLVSHTLTANLSQRSLTPLHRAVANKHHEAATLLLQAGADPNALDGEMRTPLFLAVNIQHKNMIRDLLKKRANPNIADAQGNTPLHIAARQCELLLTGDILFDYSPDAIENNEEIVQDLLENHANPNIANAKGDTPLHLAARQCDTPIIQLLLKHGADKNATNHNDETPLLKAAVFAKIKTAQALLDAGADVNASNCNGDTCLHYCFFGWYHIVALEFFLKQGANPNATNPEGQTPLHLIFKRLDDDDDNEVTRAAKLLIRAGADVDAVDDESQTPLHLAIPSYYPKGDEGADYYMLNDVAERLIVAGASPNIRNIKGQTPLQIAILNDDEDTDDEEMYNFDRIATLVRLMLASNHPIDDLEQPRPHQSYWND